MQRLTLLTLILLYAREKRPDMFPGDPEDAFLPMGEILDEMDRSFAQPFSVRPPPLWMRRNAGRITGSGSYICSLVLPWGHSSS